ncbi:hypothetical protein T01_6213 [Trichinella spiralis]|uniref:Uncharacterized protein n=1 Tax=Trichinella spiralis TaxID=6334 RepID=A0A0V0YYB7_TRISP|nr:hypothetical protein T01_6213 [Trichinella spiralis]
MPLHGLFILYLDFQLQKRATAGQKPNKCHRFDWLLFKLLTLNIANT